MATDVLEQLEAWRAAGRGATLATVIATWGSSPRPAGSQLAVDEFGAMVGSVSGGCVEGAVVEAAAEVLRSGSHRVLDFGVTDEMAWEVGLACGGEMQVLVERVVGPSAEADDEPDTGADWLARLAAARDAKRPAVLSVNLATGARAVFDAETPCGALTEAVRDALRTDRAAEAETPDGRVFLQPFNPPLRMIVVGAVHIAQPLTRIARESGYEVIVVDPRGAFATDARFPDARLVREWPDEALESLAIDTRTAVVTLTHDPKLDDPALTVALGSPAFYIGSLGSRRTHGRRLERLREAGFDYAATSRIHGPVGLDIGARSPAEIAVSIVAQATACLRESAS